jgi:hypothetical protein
MAMFKGFKPQGLQKIANRMGYTGSLEGFDSYLQQNPDKQNMMNMYNQRAMQMAQGGAVRKMQVGGTLNDKQFQSAVPTLNPEATLQRLPEAPRQETDRAYGIKPTGPGLTRAMGEDGIGPQPNVGKLPMGKIQQLDPKIAKQMRREAEDFNAGLPPLGGQPMLAKTQAVGEDDGGMGGRPLSSLMTQAVGEDGNMADAIARPIGATRAMGEDGTGPRPLIANRPVSTTRAVGEDTGMLPFDPNNPPIATTMAYGEEDPNFDPNNPFQPIFDRPPPMQPPELPPIAKTMAAGEDDGFPTQPQPLPQQYIPTTQPYQPPEDPYADYRKNVEVFPETGTFKNPAIQTSFDEMSKELEKELAPTPKPEDLKKRSDSILKYVQNIYSGPLYREDGKTFTEEFKKYAQDSGITVDGSLLNVQKDSPIATIPGYLPAQPKSKRDITDITAERLQDPSLPPSAVVKGEGVQQDPSQMIGTDVGQVEGSVAVPTAMATTTMAEVPTQTDTATMTAADSATAVNTALNATQAAQVDPNDPRAKITAAQQTTSSVGNLDAAQGNATLLENPVQREIQDGELISGVADAEKASKFTEQIQAATATPSAKATVQGQLAELTADFDANNPPAWAAGTLRAIQGKLAARGLGASSIAGQALIQGALESALPIAQADAQTQAQFESQNLSNRQQRAMLAAQQRAAFIGQEFDQAFQARVQNASRIADVANQNFTAEQQIALENSRVANTMNLQNLSNNQALVMAEASALANLDTANLNNRQQAAVQNAQSFLQRDMANLSNRQQTELFKAQQRVQSLFTDQAAENAARQFNASSQNQTDQFFANLATQTAQFNATQANAQSQYNAGQRNVLERFNAELNNQRDTFNAQNQLVIAQNNAQWRRQIATINTATVNRVNEINATNLLQTSNQAYNNLWNYYGDTMEWAWTSAENELNRYADMSIANLNADTQADVARRGASTAAGNAIGSLIGTLGSAYIMSSFGGFCWVAREVYGKADPRWYVFRMWLNYKAPKWFVKLYKNYGEDYAKFIKNKPVLKWVTKKLMDLVVEKKRMVSYG